MKILLHTQEINSWYSVVIELYTLWPIRCFFNFLPYWYQIDSCTTNNGIDRHTHTQTQTHTHTQTQTTHTTERENKIFSCCVATVTPTLGHLRYYRSCRQIHLREAMPCLMGDSTVTQGPTWTPPIR